MRAMRIALQTLLNPHYHLLWESFERSYITAQYGGVDEHCSYLSDGTCLPLSQMAIRQYYANSKKIRDPDMMARYVITDSLVPLTRFGKAFLFFKTYFDY